VNQARTLLNAYRAAWQQRTTPKGYLFLKKFEREINKSWDQIVEPFRELLRESGGSEINDAIESGFIDVHRFDSPLNRIMTDTERDGFIQEYVSVVGSSVSNQATYPLFDVSTGSLISAGIAARKIPVNEQLHMERRFRLLRICLRVCRYLRAQALRKYSIFERNLKSRSASFAAR